MKTIHHVFEIAAPPGKIFAALTTTEGLSGWWTTKVSAQAEIGAVVDFSISEGVKLEIVTPQVAPQTATTNATVTEELANIGPEPVIVRGVAAILNQPGKLVGRAVFEQRRLLPGERNTLRANYAGTLPPGKYRVLCSLEYAGKAITRTAEFIVP